MEQYGSISARLKLKLRRSMRPYAWILSATPRLNAESPVSTISTTFTRNKGNYIFYDLAYS